MIQEWFNKTIDKNLKIIFWICIAIIIIIFIWNLFTNSTGTYTNYNEMIKELFNKPNDFSIQYEKKPIFNESKGEKECRRVIEKITNKKFLKSRPDFLKNDVTGQCLELDCFNQELKIAIEYNGIQHYEYTPRFHSSKDSFYNTKYRDKIKKELCQKNGIKLIVVPYTIKLEDIENFIYKNLNN